MKKVFFATTMVCSLFAVSTSFAQKAIHNMQRRADVEKREVERTERKVPPAATAAPAASPAPAPVQTKTTRKTHTRKSRVVRTEEVKSEARPDARK